jgi:hypothetical protein
MRTDLRAAAWAAWICRLLLGVQGWTLRSVAAAARIKTGRKSGLFLPAERIGNRR